jgi:hypothetical protein
MRRVILFVLLCAIQTSGTSAVAEPQSSSHGEQDRPDIKIELLVDRAIYHRKDDVSLKIIILNDSGLHDAFIFGELGFGVRASFTLFRRDARGKEVPTRFFDDFHADVSDLNDTSSFVRLRPGHFLGINYENSIYNLNLDKPGKYRLWVEYHSPIPASAVAVRPFWGTENGPIRSNVVEIQVR